MLNPKVVLINCLLALILVLFIGIDKSFFLNFLVLVWGLNLVYNIFTGRILKEKLVERKRRDGIIMKFYPRKNLFLYLEELLLLIFLIPLFIYLELDFLFYSLAVFGFAEILVAVYILIKIQSCPLKNE